MITWADSAVRRQFPGITTRSVVDAGVVTLLIGGYSLVLVHSEDKGIPALVTDETIAPSVLRIPNWVKHHKCSLILGVDDSPVPLADNGGNTGVILENSNVGLHINALPGCVLLARFIGKVMKERSRIIHSLSRD